MYKIIRQKRKSISIAIDEEYRVIMKAPYYVTKKQIEEVVQKNKIWIEQTITQKKQKAMQNDWLTHQKILYLGEYREICILDTINGNTRIEYKNDIFYLYVSNQASKEHIRGVLEDYIKEESKILFTTLTNKYAQLVGVKYNKITIRKQKTRWGSCSSKGNLSYNMKLMCARLPSIEYVILHEVMHLRHFNHSQEFWRDIAQIIPDYKEKQLYLKKYGQYFEI